VSFARFRDDIRDEILMSRLREREVDARVSVSESEVDVYLASQGQRLGQVDEWLVSQILIPAAAESKAAEKATAKAKADSILARVRGGEPFAVAARRESASADKEQGGSLGWRTMDRLPELFSKALKGASPGDVVGPIQSAGGWHILRLDDRRSQAERPIVDVFRARHILIRVDGQTSEEAAARRLQELKRRMVLGESFGSLARSFSQDPGSAARGGELDWAYPGDLVPEFERAALQLRQGQVSDPVRTVFGFHIIEVLERKREPITEDRLRLFARMALRDRKLAEAVDEWTREVRANTYVDIKPDNP
jgi:peptidyl-prolyl cis-trans isomerase SurA